MTIKDNDIIRIRIGSTIAASPFWKPCKNCGYPIVVKKQVAYDLGNKGEPNKCKNTREQWLDHLKEVAV